MKIRKIITSLVLGTIMIASGSVAFANEPTENEPLPSISSTPPSFNFGEIQMEEGKVSTKFLIKNNGPEKLKINRLSTSCGCTTAEMDMSDIVAGGSREMLVTYDPKVHPDQIGEIKRVIYLQTSDPVIPELEIDLTAIVVAQTKTENGENTNSKTTENSEKDITATKNTNIVFFNEACQDCGELVKKTYPKLFAEYGIKLTNKDYINERENRKELNEFNERWGIPFELQSHIEAFIGNNLLIGGHVPEPIIRYLLENPEKYKKLLVYQDKMHGEETDYKVWDFEGEIITYPIDTPITEYLSMQNHGKSENKINPKGGFLGLFALISTSAFLDGINPCAIAVLLFFIGFLFSIKKTKRSIWKMGIVYISAIFLAYLLIGVGLARAIVISGAPHLMAYIGAYLVIGLGVIQLLTIVFPKFPIKLRIPISTKAVLEKWLYQATIPAAFIGGFVVGLCTFPCSGGIYVAIIGMLSATQTQFQGFLWMLWYNILFVAPLVILLVLAANPKTTEKLQKWERKESKKSKVIIGITMISLGLIILYFFV